jgi:adenylosuccinate lyase
MIARYTRKEMRDIWTEESKFQAMLDVEIAVCRAHNKLGNISAQDLKNIEEKACFCVDRILEIEEEVKHDIIAFVTCLNENIGESSRFVHMGITSSDVIDTGLAVQLQRANKLIQQDIIAVIDAIREKAKQHKETIMIGRSHGIHAEPTTFAAKLCNWLDIMERNLERFNIVAEEINVGQVSGPVGTFSNVDPQIEELVCEELGLKPAKVSTQVIQRDLHAHYHQVLALIASTIEQFAIELRHLQRTELLEVEEGFAKGQKGSSAMPHKKNPISGENLTGLARLVRSNSFAALENIPLWHERDISHSSVERVIFPDSTILIDYMLNRFKGVINNLVVYPENMLRNTQIFGGVIYSQRVLLKLTDKGLSREEAYKLVQTNAHKAWNQIGGDFKKNLLNDVNVTGLLSEIEINECFDPKYYLRNINHIYTRMGV